MVTTIIIKSLLNNTNRVVRHQKEIESLKGERFNIFSVLKMERRENTTHSAFLYELLNPNGSHSKGDIFFKLFMAHLRVECMDYPTIQVKKEYDIGLVNYENKTGGRIDIYCWDKIGNSISIENKIDASDQLVQVERYCNHNKEKNKVYYLTLNGTEPVPESKGNLKTGEDFFTLSYKEDIVEWLRLCLKEVSDSPMLRETIKQYILLIQKLTSVMDNTTEKELVDVMLENIEAASYVAANFNKVRKVIGEEIRQEVLRNLQIVLAGYTIIPGNIAQNKYSQIWIKIKGKEDSDLFFGLESFSGEGNFAGNLFMGVFDQSKGLSKYAKQEGNIPFGNLWINIAELADYEGHIFNLSNTLTIIELQTNKKFRKEFINHITKSVESYLEIEYQKLLRFLNNKQ